MSWTWTGYDYDPVFRYKDEATFFQTGRNNAEARLPKLLSLTVDDVSIANIATGETSQAITS